MTTPNDALSGVVQGLRVTIHKVVTEDTQTVDRVLLALTLAAGAAAVAWPPDKKAPKIAMTALQVVREIWARREWLAPA